MAIKSVRDNKGNVYTVGKRGPGELSEATVKTIVLRHGMYTITFKEISGVISFSEKRATRLR